MTNDSEASIACRKILKQLGGEENSGVDPETRGHFFRDIDEDSPPIYGKRVQQITPPETEVK